MRLTPAGRPVPSAGLGSRTNGLPWVKDRVVQPSPGSLDAARTAVTIADVQQRIDALGVVCTPEMSLADAILSASTPLGGAKLRVLLTAGTWDFVEGLTISQDNVEIVALSPGHTLFRARTAAALPMLTITGAYVRIQGVTFSDQLGTASVPLYVRGPYATIQDCVFAQGKGIKVEPSGTGRCDGVVIRDCLFDLACAGGVEITGLNDICQVLDNRFLAGAAASIILISSALTTNTVIVGNSLASPGVIAYPFGYGTIETGNTPSGGYLSRAFTLADSQVARADVSNTVSWDVSRTYGVSLDFALYRGATPDVCTGRLDLVMNSAECLVYMDAVTTTVDPGVLFYGTVVAGIAYLQYTTTATGAAATLRFTSVKESAY